MQIGLALIIAIFATSVFGQGDEFYSGDSLEVRELNYEMLDSNATRLLRKDFNVGTNDFFYFPSSHDQINVVCVMSNENQWASISLPLESSFFIVTDLRQVNLDKKGKPELVIEGCYRDFGTGGGTSVRWLTIVDINSVPTQIFKVTYGCSEESFGDRQNNGEGRYYNEYERKIVLSENGIIISRLGKRKYLFYECRLTEIPSGKYVMEGGQIRRKNKR